ncbi:hypothetical protein [Haloarchaeobius sp. HRN-SO-5]|uniref:hypothetical protein n=1 Tax=Haloarchaeobius sp. HRN-SO-5 TaxID=3446118 RepID=UPI003EC12307
MSGKKPLAKAKHLHHEYEVALDEFNEHATEEPGKYALFNTIRDLILGTEFKSGGSQTRAAIYQQLGVTETVEKISSEWASKYDDVSVVFGQDYAFKDAFLLDELPHDSKKDPFNHGGYANEFIEYGRELYSKQIKVEKKARRLVAYIKFGDETYGSGAYPYGHHLGTLTQEEQGIIKGTLDSSMSSTDQTYLYAIARLLGINTNQDFGDIAAELEDAVDSMTYNPFYDDFLHAKATGKTDDPLEQIILDTSQRFYYEQLKDLDAITHRLYESHTGKMFLAEQFEKQNISAPDDVPQRLKNRSMFPPSRIVDPNLDAQVIYEPHREQPFRYARETKSDYFEKRSGQHTQQYGRISDPSDSFWDSNGITAFNRVASAFMHGAWHYYSAYKTVTIYGNKKFLGDDGLGIRELTVENYIGMYVSRLLDDSQLTAICKKIIAELKSGDVESGEIYTLADRLDLPKNGTHAAVKNSVKSEVKSLKSNISVYDKKLETARKVAALTAGWGWDQTHETDWFDDATEAASAWAKVGFSIVGVITTGIQTYSVLESTNSIGTKADQMASLVNAMRGFVASLSSLESTSLFAKGTISEASAVKIAGKLAVVFNLYESIKNFCYSYSEYIDGDYDQSIGYAFMGASFGCFVYAYAAAGVSWIPGLGQAIALGIVAGTIGYLVLGWATDSELEEWVKYSYFGRSAEAVKTKKNMDSSAWYADTSKPYFGFRFPSNYLHLERPDEKGAAPGIENMSEAENYFGQISALVTLAKPIGIEHDDAKLRWAGDKDEGTFRIKPDAAASGESQIGPSGYLVIRPLSDKNGVQSETPSRYASDNAHVEFLSDEKDDLEPGETTDGPQPPLHLISLSYKGSPSPNNPAGIPATETTLWFKGQGTTHTPSDIVLTDGKIKRWTSTLKPSGNDPVHAFGFDSDSTEQEPYLEFIYLEREQARELKRVDYSNWGMFLDSVPAPREYRSIEEGSV